MYKVPILFVIFCRKDISLRSFESIRQAKPDKLYIACDGPRENVEGESLLVEETRKAILDAIDWECDVHTLFHEKNLGCGKGVFTAISWLFENEERGIILEDDCVAQESFFQYAEEMLEKYKADERIGMIAGTNQVKDYQIPDSYCFSKYTVCWGWATWRRAWKNMKMDLDFLRDHKKDIFLNRGYLGKEKPRWRYELKCIKNNYVSAWDWQWYFSLAAQNQLCIFPQKNLISNIGNDDKATHTSYSEIYIESAPLEFPLHHPVNVLPDYTFDHKFYKQNNTFIERVKRSVPHAMKMQIKKLVKGY